MRIFVDELPKDCIDCPCESEYYCNLLNEDVGCCKWGEIHKNCPLQSLADYTKQVRKEVCDEIRTFAYDTFKEFGYFDETDLEHILDQIQGETKNAETKNL